MTDQHDPKLTNSALLLQISSRLAVIESRLEVLADYDSRIRELEKARYQSAWISSILSAALSSAIVFTIIKGLGG